MSARRLRADDLAAPFRGVRSRRITLDAEDGLEDPYAVQRRRQLLRAREYAPRMGVGHFFSHQTAAAIWGAPLPVLADPDEVHIGVAGAGALPRLAGVVRHRTQLSATIVRNVDGLRVSSPAMTWGSLGSLSLFDVVVAGDFFCRRWRDGVGRPPPRPPLTTVAELDRFLALGRRVGGPNLRAALRLVREDSWSPRESRARVELVLGGLPEPECNVDVFDDRGRFIACVDLVYRRERVAVEYFGMLHGPGWAEDVERIERLRAAGWVVIEVTSPLLHRPRDLVARVAAALRARS